MGGAQTAGVHYRLSFTAGGLFADAAPTVVAVYLRTLDFTAEDGAGAWAAVRAEIERDNLLQTRTAASSKRLANEVVQRLATHSDSELALLAEATATERGHLLWVAACRQYEFVGEFAQEVVRERFLLMRPALTHGDFDDFVAAKALWHEELADLKPSTLEKVRATLFRMMRQAGLMDDDGTLHRVVLSPRVADVLAERAPGDLRYFPNVDGRRGDS